MLQSVEYRRTDGTYVATVGGYPYHVTPSTPYWDEAQELGADAPFEPEPEVPPPLTPEQVLAGMPPVSHAQIIAALILSEIITEAEGVAWISGTLPAAVEAMIATLPADQRVIARLRAIRPTSVVPTDPLVAALAAAQGQGVEDLIALFQTAAAL